MSSLDTRALETLTKMKREREANRGGGDNGGGGDHTGGHEPPGGNGVEARVARLESDVEYIKRDIEEIKGAVKIIQGDVNLLKTQSAVLLERTANIEKGMSGLVTKGQLAAYALGVLVTITGGTWWIVQQYLAPILAGLAKLPTI